MNIALTALRLTIIYTGITFAIYYGLQDNWGVSLGASLGTLIVFICKGKN